MRDSKSFTTRYYEDVCTREKQMNTPEKSCLSVNKQEIREMWWYAKFAYWHSDRRKFLIDLLHWRQYTWILSVRENLKNFQQMGIHWHPHSQAYSCQCSKSMRNFWSTEKIRVLAGCSFRPPDTATTCGKNLRFLQENNETWKQYSDRKFSGWLPVGSCRKVGILFARCVVFLQEPARTLRPAFTSMQQIYWKFWTTGVA